MSYYGSVGFSEPYLLGTEVSHRMIGPPLWVAGNIIACMIRGADQLDRLPCTLFNCRNDHVAEARMTGRIACVWVGAAYEAYSAVSQAQSPATGSLYEHPVCI